MQSIFKFHPIYQERPWGGHAIVRVGKHHCPASDKKIGESWEISDRPGDESIVKEGEFQGKSIRWLLDHHGSFVMGRPWKRGQRFPLLVKVLDAAERLSLQVHPPPRVALELGGEPKTEMWCLLDAKPGAAVLAGLKKGVRRKEFEQGLRSGELEPLIHRTPVFRGDVMLIPSGRIHAIDAGCLILEIQQNSDTTYRIHDWGRVGPDGKPRQLHVEQTLRSMDFNDFEPKLEPRAYFLDRRPLAFCRHFRVVCIKTQKKLQLPPKSATIIHVLQGSIKINSSGLKSKAFLQKGETALLPAMPHEIYPVREKAEYILTSDF